MSPAPVIWLTGLSGAGKSTLANALASHLKAKGVPFEILDGDVIREALNNQSFEQAERKRNVKTVGVMARLLQKHGVVVISAMISPYRDSRDFVRSVCDPFFEVYVATSLEECERRDVKGLYKKARAGEIRQFTGLDDPYEAPLLPELILDTTKKTVEECVQEILERVGIEKIQTVRGS